MLRNILLLLLLPTVAFAAAPPPSTEIATFKEKTLQVRPAMKEKAVIALLGEPGEIVTSREHAGLPKLKASRGLLYWHPEYATVHFLVGLKDGVVTRTAICLASGSSIQTTECSSADAYWKEEGL